jgi:hypothetical protein
LDIESGKMRFLDPYHRGDGNPGKAFPLRIRLGSVFTPENLVGVKGEKSQIDTGCNFDGTLKPKLWQRKLREQTAVETNAAGMCSKGAWGGETYTNLMLFEYGGFGGGHNLVGLRFLARHKVTLNFPKRTIEQAAPPGSNTMVIPEADRWAIRYWFHEIAEPVKAWFREHLPAPLNGQADNRVQRRTESVRNVDFSEAPMTRSRSILEPATVGPGLRTPPK